MRPGPPRGDSISVELTVTSDLAASLAPGLPAVCTPPAILATAEQASRTLVTPHLDAGEIAMVVEVDLAMRTPLPAGTTATVTATVASVTSNELVSEVLIRQAGTLVARGSLRLRIADARTLGTEIADRLPATST